MITPDDRHTTRPSGSVTAVVALLSGVVLTACSSEPERAGDVSGTVGEPADLTQKLSLPGVEVHLESVVKDAQCSDGGLRPSNGDFIAVEVTVRNAGDEDVVGMSSFEWQAIGSDGASIPAHAKVPTYGCFAPDQQFPLEFDGADEVSGTLLFDAPADTERLVGSAIYVNPSPTFTLDLG